MKKCVLRIMLCSSTVFFAQAVHAQEAVAVTQTVASATPEAPAAVSKELPRDPKVNPKVPFKSTYRSKAPVPVYFSYFYLGGRFSKELNQLTVVDRARLTGSNVVSGMLVAWDAINGRVKIGGNPYDFQTRDTIVGDQILDIVARGKLENPAVNDVPRLLDLAVIDYVNKTPSVKSQEYLEKLIVRPVQWSLVFDDSDSGLDTARYALKFKATVSKNMEGEKDSLFHKAQEKGALCSFSSDLKSLAQWQANDYAEVAALREKILSKCIQSITESLPDILEEGFTLKVQIPEQRIRGNQVKCKDEYRQCLGIAKDDVVDRAESVKECKVEYKQCRVENVQPLVDATPIGKCKVAMNDCRRKSIDKAHLVSPTAKPDRNELKVCSTEVRACIKRVKNDGDKVDADEDSSNDSEENVDAQ